MIIERMTDDSIIVLMPDGSCAECAPLATAADLFGYSRRHMLTLVDTGAYAGFKIGGRWFVIVREIEIHL